MAYPNLVQSIDPRKFVWARFLSFFTVANRLPTDHPVANRHLSSMLCHQYSIRSRLVKRITPNESDFLWWLGTNGWNRTTVKAFVTYSTRMGVSDFLNATIAHHIRHALLSHSTLFIGTVKGLPWKNLSCRKWLAHKNLGQIAAGRPRHNSLCDKDLWLIHTWDSGSAADSICVIRSVSIRRLHQSTHSIMELREQTIASVLIVFDNRIHK